MECLEVILKVRDLIKELLDYNPDAEVVTSQTETIEISYIGEPFTEDCSDKLNTLFVFIDGCDYEETVDD